MGMRSCREPMTMTKRPRKTHESRKENCFAMKLFSCSQKMTRMEQMREKNLTTPSGRSVRRMLGVRKWASRRAMNLLHGKTMK
jgi:hypothetical protein